MAFRLVFVLPLILFGQRAMAAKHCILLTDDFFKSHRQELRIEAVPQTLMPNSAPVFTHTTDDLFRLALLDNLARALSDRGPLQLDQWLVNNLQSGQHLVVPVRRRSGEFVELWAEGSRIRYRFFKQSFNQRVYSEAGVVDSHSHASWHQALMSQPRGFDFGESLLTDFANSQDLARTVLKNLDSSQLMTRWGYFEPFGFRNLMLELASKVKVGEFYTDPERLLRVSWVDDKYLKIVDAREGLSYLILKSEIYGTNKRLSVFILTRETDETVHRVIKLNAHGALELESAGLDPRIGVDLYRPVAKMPQRLLTLLGR
jgi:hypothetical protein